MTPTKPPVDEKALEAAMFAYAEQPLIDGAAAAIRSAIEAYEQARAQNPNTCPKCGTRNGWEGDTFHGCMCAYYAKALPQSRVVDDDESMQTEQSVDENKVWAEIFSAVGRYFENRGGRKPYLPEETIMTAIRPYLRQPVQAPESVNGE